MSSPDGANNTLHSSSSGSPSPAASTNTPSAADTKDVKASYTAEETNFHKAFPDVPLNEKLVESYQCGLSKNKLVSMGRMYLTSIRVCFFASFPKKTMNVEWDHVKSIEKKSNFLFEAVVVTTMTKEEHFFSAFMFGQSETAQKLMNMLWSVRNKYRSGGTPSASPNHSSRELPSNASMDKNPVAAGDVPKEKKASALAAETQKPQEDVQEAAPAPPAAVAEDGKESPVDENLPLLDTTSTPSTAAAAIEKAATPAKETTPPVAQEEPKPASEQPAPSPQPTADAKEQPPMASIEKTPSAKTASVSDVDFFTATNSAPEEARTDADAAVAANASFTNASLGVQSAASNQPNNSGNIADLLQQDNSVPTNIEQPAAAEPLPVAASTPPLKESQSSPAVTPSKAKVGNDRTTPTEPKATTPPPPVSSATAALAAKSSVVELLQPPAPTAAKKSQQSSADNRRNQESDSPSKGDFNVAGRNTNSKQHAILSHFPSVPETETIIDSFQCSFVSGVHRLGKMHITTNFILFSSVMFTEGVCIKFGEVQALEKQTTMVVFEGVTITTKKNKTYEFTSFANRDAAFRILQQLHVAHVGKQQYLERRSVSPSQSASADASPPSVESPTEASTATAPAAAVPTATQQQAPSPNSDAGSASPTATAPTIDTTGSTSKGIEFEFLTSTAQPHYDSWPSASSINDFDKYGTDFGTGLSIVKDMQEKLIVEDRNMPKGYSVIDIFKYIFDDDPKLLDNYHADRKDSLMEWEQWRPCLGGAAQTAGNNGQRKMTCKTIIKAMFQTTCDFTEFSKYAFLNVDDKPTLLVQFSGQAVGVPQSDTFRAETLLIFTQTSGKSVGADVQVSAKVYGHIQFVKTCWVKGKVLKTALGSEMPGSYGTLLDMAADYIKKIPSSGVGMVPPNPRAIADAELNKKELSQTSKTLSPLTDEAAQEFPEAAGRSRGGSLAPMESTGVHHHHRHATPVAAGSSSGVLLSMPSEGSPLYTAIEIICVFGALWCVRALWSVFWMYAPEDSPEAQATIDMLRPPIMAFLYLLLVLFLCASKNILSRYIPGLA